jgi:hypothetical protein
MSTPPKPEPEIIFAVCPYCGKDPLTLHRLRQDFPDGVIIEVFFCSNDECRKAFSAQIVGRERVR